MDGAAQLVVFAVIGAFVGFLCGLIPFRTANERNQAGLAIAAIISCVLLGFLGGCFLALPAAYVFKWNSMSVGVVERDLPAFSHQTQSDYGSQSPRRGRDRFDQPPLLPYTILGTAVVCNSCGKACSKVDGQPPGECPNCRARFSQGVVDTPKPWKQAKRATAQPAEDDFIPLERA